MIILVDQFKALGFPAPLPLRKLHGVGRREEEEERKEKGDGTERVGGYTATQPQDQGPSL